MRGRASPDSGCTPNGASAVEEGLECISLMDQLRSCRDLLPLLPPEEAVR